MSGDSSIFTISVARDSFGMQVSGRSGDNVSVSVFDVASGACLTSSCQSNGGGGVPSTPSPAGSDLVTYSVKSTWSSGFVGEFTDTSNQRDVRRKTIKIKYRVADMYSFDVDNIWNAFERSPKTTNGDIVILTIFARSSSFGFRVKRRGSETLLGAYIDDECILSQCLEALN